MVLKAGRPTSRTARRASPTPPPPCSPRAPPPARRSRSPRPSTSWAATSAPTPGLESGYATAAVTSDQLDLGFDLLSDVVLHPSFPQEEIERWRRPGPERPPDPAAERRLSRRARRRSASSSATTPTAGRPRAPRSRSRSLTRDDLVAFHKRHFIPNEAILAVVGDVKPADAFARAERAFGGWAKGEPPASSRRSAVPRLRTPQIVVIDKPDAVQTEIRLGQVGVAYRDPDLFTAEVYNSVAGRQPQRPPLQGDPPEAGPLLRRQQRLRRGQPAGLVPGLRPSPRRRPRPTP